MAPAAAGFAALLRWAGVLAVLSTCASYIVTQTFLWTYVVPDRRKFFPFRPNLVLTPQQLARHDGRDPSKPLYLAINGTIFDVTAGRRFYGPGGAYEQFGGRDCARAFATGCLASAEHRTHDLRGLTDGELRHLEKWKRFYENHPQYFRVGVVRNQAIDPRSRVPGPCEEGGTRSRKMAGAPRPPLAQGYG
ncbi:cytochrome b5-like heme/steroid binding domain-containing protein [Hyaloraphidium curvatum]|nr:cytochrome b5-like heme/steroid binding domain-containing protein [Hyaloraphidium curvatum]